MKIQFCAFAAAALLLASCNGDDETTREPLPIPSAYEGVNYDANTTVENSVLTNLKSQVIVAKLGRNPGVVVELAALEAPYLAGAPSLSDVSTNYFVGKMEGPAGYMNELANSSGNTYTPGDPDLSGEGGVYGPYLFDETGLEMEQLLEKGQFGAVLYNHFTALITGPVSVETTDRMVAIFGAHPTFPNTNNAVNAEFPDQFMANYAARRDKADGNGLYTQMKNNFIKLQAAVNAGSVYDTEKQEAIDALKITWEQINAATVINYCHGATSALSESDPSDDQKAGAFHSIGEAIGFIHGWKTIPTSAKLITDAEIDETLVLLNAPADTPSTVYTFATDALNQLPQLQDVISKLQDIYGFTDQQVDDFRSNWVTVQGR